MIRNIYCYRDTLANYYKVPFLDDHNPDELAKLVTRSLVTCNEPKQLAILYDCDLFHLGTFDDESAKFNLIEPVKILTCADYVKK